MEPFLEPWLMPWPRVVILPSDNRITVSNFAHPGNWPSTRVTFTVCDARYIDLIKIHINVFDGCYFRSQFCNSISWMQTKDHLLRSNCWQLVITNDNGNIYVCFEWFWNWTWKIAGFILFHITIKVKKSFKVDEFSSDSGSQMNGTWIKVNMSKEFS